MKKAVLYARVSSKEQEKEGFSIPAQEKFLEEYAKKNNIEIVAKFVEAKTAKASGRTNFNDMIKFLETNKSVKVILVEKTDRLTRNFKDMAIIDDLIELLDLELHLPKENAIISKTSRSTEKLVWGFKALIAKNTIDNLREETIKGMLEKAEQGIYPSKAPIGYLNIKGKDGKNIIGVDFQKAHYIKRMFELYSTGVYSLNTLRQKIFEEGFSYSGNKPLPKSIVELILKNEFYTGVFYWKGKRYNEVQHDGIISKELFFKVQEKLIDPRKAKTFKNDFPYTNMIKCSICGCYLTADVKKGKYIYYYCTQNKEKHPIKYVRQEVFEETFKELFRNIRLSQDEINQIIEGLKFMHKQRVEYSDLTLVQIQKRITQIKNLLDKAYEDKLEGNISEDFWKQKTKQWQKEQDELLIKLNAFNENENEKNYLITASLILELAKNAYDLFLRQSQEDKRKLLNLVCSNFSFDNKELDIELVSPFNLIIEANRLKTAEIIEFKKDTDDKPVSFSIKWLPR